MKKWFIGSVMVVSIMFGTVTVARADCASGGVVYPEGTFIGGKVCIGGRWVRR